ncbi:chaperonin 10-like protein [Fusarium solani]|uniref:alcohol dehydrogenase (NADP(+)) n=1 Tax=Fusarium solani TaxID=169388 RepID=A0A9P9G4P3_FUSSL|nr:chaperonin 10-like protein [Fusarium solani]KAH7232488.1 chaperonin 10-like protein [Fusarium solani]
MTTDYKFEGWVGEDTSSARGNLVWKEFKPKRWEETDVDIQVTHSAICGSDIHTLSNGWGSTKFPCVVGHEIVGKVLRVGSRVDNVAVGDIVGVGCQSDSCLSRDGPCEACESQTENYCPKRVSTYNSVHRNGDFAQGGYSLYHRCPAFFVVRLPPGIAPEHASPMLCGGLTVFSPLKRYNAGPGKSVGVIGVGGLGHFAILFAKAMGASKVVAISRSLSKKQDALDLGADDYIASSEDKDWASKHALSLDIIINTTSSAKMPLAQYIGLSKLGGVFVQLGAPDDPLTLNAFTLIRSKVHLTGSYIGSPKDIREMFELAAAKKIEPWVQLRPMQEANEAIVDMENGLARYRYVLTN